MENKYGPWIQTYSGICFEPLSPNPASINLIDVIHALSMMNRFGGHQRPPYSVGQHTLRVVTEVEKKCLSLGWNEERTLRVRLGAWKHDGSEGLGLADIVRPIKKTKQLEGYVEIENVVDDALSKKLDLFLDEEERNLVKWADNRALAGEVRDNLHISDKKWEIRAEPYEEDTQYWSYGVIKVNLFRVYSQIIHAMRDRKKRREDLLFDVERYLQTLAPGLVSGGSSYRHYGGNVYGVVGVSLDKHTLMPMISYSDGKYTWTQELFLWEEYVPIEGGRLVPRFSPV